MSYPILKPNSAWFSPNVSTVTRNTLTTINIVDTYTPSDAAAVVDSWDASNAQDGSIMCYVEGTVLTIAGNGSGKIVANEDSSYAFSDTSKKDYFNKVTELNGLGLVDTSNVTTMYNMFYNCVIVGALDVSDWDVSNVTTMERMFNICEYITELDLSKWDVSKVTTFRHFCYQCARLITFKARDWNMSSSESVGAMFEKCFSLANVDIVNWNLPKVYELSIMFRRCNALQNVDLSGWKTGSMLWPNNMFDTCGKLKTVTFGEGWDSSTVTHPYQMFSGCSSLTTVDVSKWDTSKFLEAQGMFNGCSSLTELDLSNWNTSAATKLTSLFNGCNNLRRILLGSKFNFKGSGSTSCTLPTPSKTYIDGADGKWYALRGEIYTPAEVPSLTAAAYYASEALAKAARIDINFNDEDYIIDKAFLSSAIEELETHFSTVINGTGTTIKFRDGEYNIDATKLLTATNAIISHLETLAGSGKTINIGGIEYSVDAAKVATIISNLEKIFVDLETIGESVEDNNNTVSNNKLMSPAIRRPTLTIDEEF